MAVAYDNSATAEDFGVQTLSTPPFTISGANRAAMVGFYGTAATTGMSATCGGVSGSLITGAKGNNGSVWMELWSVLAPATGSQTASMSWTGAVSASIGVITATGVDQGTPVNNGGYAQSASPTSLPVTSAAGDLTVTVCGNDFAVSTQTSNYTKRITALGSMDTGPGTANPTHTWTQATSAQAIAGANFKAAGGGGGDLSVGVGAIGEPVVGGSVF